jgi:hypothetical protein
LNNTEKLPLINQILKKESLLEAITLLSNLKQQLTNLKIYLIMKNRKFTLVLTIAIVMVITGCVDNYPKYSYGIEQMLPDSLKAKEMTFITETMKATDFHLTTSDYEDPEDVVQELRFTYEKTNSVPVEGLYIQTDPQRMSDFIPYDRLNEKQKQIFERLRNGEDVK